MTKLWEKNSTQKSDRELQKRVESFTIGNDYKLDQVLIPYDVRASKAHAEGLQKIGILDEEEVRRLHEALDDIHERWSRGEFNIALEDEDGHTAIENDLREQLGNLGKKIHTGRSRNDQVLTALRMYERAKLGEVACKAVGLAALFVDFADQYSNVPMPGYTHTQRAMLSSVGMWSAAFGELILLNLEYIKAIHRNVNRCPLGTAAGYGVNFELPREFLAERLGFRAPIVTSMTAQHTRGRVEADLLDALVSLGGTLSHFANDLIWFTSREFDFFDVAEELCTGSSIMPQKKNLDTAENLRAKYGELSGNADQLRQITHNLVSGYHRDLQLTKEPVMKGLQISKEMLEMTQILVEHIKPKEKQLKKACTPEIFAADRANDLVKKGMSFRDAYRQVADNLDGLEEIDVAANLESKTHLGATGNLGLDKLRNQIEAFELTE